MNKQEQVQQMTTYMANFVSHIAKVLPDDIIKKLAIKVVICCTCSCLFIPMPP